LFIIPSNQIDESKSLIIYFSRAGENYSVGKVDKGNTEMIVDYITQVTNIKSFKINPETAYPESYSETIEIARNEKSSNARPKIRDPLTNIDNYDTILLGYPIWHTDLPNIVMTQLELLNFEGKTIYPFNTHEGSGTGNSINDIKKVVPSAIVKDGFALRGQDARKNESRANIEKWLKEDLELNLNNSTITDDDEEIDRIPQSNNKSNIINISICLLLFILII
jgi:flavodoxin